MLVESLVRDGTVMRDRLVAEVLRGHRPAVSGRTVKHRFRAAMGLTRGAVRQIERAAQRRTCWLPATRLLLDE